MRRIVAGITSLEEHLEMIRQKPEAYRPLSCPHCGIKQLRQHGYYYRQADRRAQRLRLDPVPICRYRCVGCRRTCSRLPECIAPRRWFPWSVQEQFLSPRVGATPAGCGDDGQPTARSIGRWWRWLRDRGALFALHLRARFPELGRTSEFCGFWRQVFSSLGLARAMAWLDQEISVP